MANAGVSANISALLEYSREQQQGASQTVRTSTLLAGHDLLQAAQGTLHWQGTQAQARNDLSLTAGTGLVLESARNRQQYREESQSGSVQYDLYGTSAGALNVSLAGSQYQQVGVTQVNSHAFAGGDLRLDSGGDATVAGAVVEGQTLTTTVAGDLAVASRQDTGHITGSSASLGIGRQDEKGATSLSIGGGHIQGESAWVGEQTALLGRDGATVTVGGTTAVTGAVIGSPTAGALALTTGALTVTDLRDVNDYRNTQLNLGGLPGGTWGEQRPDQQNAGATGAPRVEGSYTSSHAEQINRATLTTGEVTVSGQSAAETAAQLAGVNRDLASAQEVTRDESTHLDIYASTSSVGALVDPAGYVNEIGQKLDERKQQVAAAVEVVSGVIQVIKINREYAAYLDEIDQELRANGSSLAQVMAEINPEDVNTSLGLSDAAAKAGALLDAAINKVYLKRLDELFVKAGATKDQIVAVMRDADGKYRVVNRLTGAVGVLTDSAEIVGAHFAGVALAAPTGGVSEGAAVAFTVLKADDLSANFMTMITGETVPTLKEKVLVSVGVSEDQSAMISGLISVNVGGTARQMATDAISASNKAPVHHICTDKNCISAASGGPWTPRFEAIFDKAGMNLNDGLNKVAVPGHKGPHPEEYHQAVFDRLTSATYGLDGDAYRKALQDELGAIGAELRTPGSLLNKLITRP